VLEENIQGRVIQIIIKNDKKVKLMQIASLRQARNESGVGSDDVGRCSILIMLVIVIMLIV